MTAKQAPRDEPPYTIEPFPWVRVPVLDALRATPRKPLMYALTEVDVTEARRYLREYRSQRGESLSFTAFVTGCVAAAVAEHPEMQVYQQGRRRLIRFEQVDICMPVERAAAGGQQALPMVIRAANHKSVEAIQYELRATQAAGLGGAWSARGRRLYPYLPRPVRSGFWWAFNRSPRLKRRIGGTVMVSSVGMFGHGAGWGISQVSGYTLEVLIGGIVTRPALIDGALTNREYLCLTVSADHEVVDGAPMARFVQRLHELIEQGYGLNDLASLETAASMESESANQPTAAAVAHALP